MTFRENLSGTLMNIGEGCMNEVIPGLFLGSAKDGGDKALLDQFQISHLVAVHNLAKKEFSDRQYLILHLADNSHQNLVKFISGVNNFIHGARLQQKNVLVHCVSGISRSAFFTTAYLMAVCRAGLSEASSVVRLARPIALPNYGFMRQLEQFSLSGVELETARLVNKFGYLWLEKERGELVTRLDMYKNMVNSGELCEGRCPSRSRCPSHTCRSPQRQQQQFNIFRSRRRSSANDTWEHSTGGTFNGDQDIMGIERFGNLGTGNGKHENGVQRNEGINIKNPNVRRPDRTNTFREEEGSISNKGQTGTKSSAVEVRLDAETLRERRSGVMSWPPHNDAHGTSRSWKRMLPPWCIRKTDKRLMENFDKDDIMTNLRSASVCPDCSSSPGPILRGVNISSSSITSSLPFEESTSPIKTKKKITNFFSLPGTPNKTKTKDKIL